MGAYWGMGRFMRLVNGKIRPGLVLPRFVVTQVKEKLIFDC
jgi:hypothetical protein